jgi:hypothetical protein
MPLYSLKAYNVHFILRIKNMRGKVERKTVGREGFGERSRARGYNRRQDNNTTSLFFHNFSEEVTMADLWKIFLKFGRAWDIYIPQKLDKRGCRFGFVKFLDVYYVKDLLLRLEEVWWGTYKLRFKLAKYDRSAPRIEESCAAKHNREVVGSLGRDREDGGRTGRKVDRDKSYKEVLECDRYVASIEEPGLKAHCEEESPTVLPCCSHTRKEVWKVVPEPAQLQLLQASLVGYLKDSKYALAIQGRIMLEGYHFISATPLGGAQILLSSSGLHDLSSVVLENKVWWESWFLKLEPWLPSFSVSRREDWVRCYGTPLQVWGLNFFEELASQFGSFIELDEETRVKSRLDVARVKISLANDQVVDLHKEVWVDGIPFVPTLVEEKPSLPAAEGFRREGAMMVVVMLFRR